GCFRRPGRARIHARARRRAAAPPLSASSDSSLRLRFGWSTRAVGHRPSHRTARVAGQLLVLRVYAAVPRVPLLSGTRIAVVDVPPDGVLLRPPAPGRAIADVGAAVREALRFPLSGPPLEQ